jgi:phosphoenolpyruvate carboxykinase (GTP)
MGEYWQHWLGIKSKVTKLPRIYRVNWFRKDENGKFVWPGFGENMRVLKWIVDRVNGRATDSPEGPFGFQPRYGDLHWAGLDFGKDKDKRIADIDRAEALEEAEDQSAHFEQFGGRLPAELEAKRQDLIRRLKAAPPVWTAD